MVVLEDKWEVNETLRIHPQRTINTYIKFSGISISTCWALLLRGVFLQESFQKQGLSWISSLELVLHTETGCTWLVHLITGGNFVWQLIQSVSAVKTAGDALDSFSLAINLFPPWQQNRLHESELLNWADLTLLGHHHFCFHTCACHLCACSQSIHTKGEKIKEGKKISIRYVSN